jgi:membrane fusion protein (multidrug efflux system)
MNLRRSLIRTACAGLGASAGLGLTLWMSGAVAQNIPGRLPAEGIAPEIRAQLTARQYTTLSSEMAGRIDRLATRVGDSFRKGDVLVAIDCSVQRAQLARSDAVVTQAEKTYAINQRLFTLKSIGQLELEVSQAEVLKAKADQAMARAVTTKCTIQAPFDGVTVEQKAREFQYASPGLPLIEVLDSGSLEIELIAPSRWLNFLKPGTVFSVHVDEINKTYPARVTRLSGRVDPVSQSVKVIGEITAEAPELMAGMSGNATITTPR